MFKFGLEHEVAFLTPGGEFADFTTTRFESFDAIIQRLPLYPTDYPMLRIGDLGIKHKRWYIEGYERYADDGSYVATVPKGIEIRTTMHDTIGGAVAELDASFRHLLEHTGPAGYEPVWISLNPYQTRFLPDPPLNHWEQARRASSPEKITADIPMLTYGPDLNLSLASLDVAGVIDAGQKLTYYSPWIVPFSFSSPFFGGERWHGYSKRTHLRTGDRPAVMVFLADPADLVKSRPSLTKPARIPAEAGRIEFKACDAFADFRLYGAMLALLKGLVLDTTLPGRRMTPDKLIHQRVAESGFDDDDVVRGAAELLAAARAALAGDPDAALLAPLDAMLAGRETPAHQLLAEYGRTGSILATLHQSYVKFSA